LDGVPLAAAVFLRWNRTLVYKFGASDPARLDLRPNHALFWRAVEAAFEDGDSRVDFGRTDADNAGLRAFKSQWGAEETPLVYATSDTAPTARTLAPRLSRRVIQVAPSWVCRVLGERLYRYAS
jgi:CelD/BcsL family acetyltransferase involved in cellulose biosynthesis